MPASLRAALLACLACLAMALAQTWDAWTAARPVLIGGGLEPDWTGTAWAWWWTWEALLRGLDPFAGAWNLVPVGHEPVAQYNLVDGLLFGWALHFIGPTRGYNLGCLLILATTGAAGVRLARVAGATWWASLVAGLALQCSSFASTELQRGRVGQVMMVFFVLALAETIRLCRSEGATGQALITGLLAALTALSYWFYALFLALAAFPFAIAGLRRRPRHVALHLTAAVACCVVVCLPAVAALAAAGTDLPGFTRPYTEGMPPLQWTGGDVGMAMAMGDSPEPWWPLSNTGAVGVQRRPGLVLLVFVGLAVAAPWRDRSRPRWPWVAAALLGYAFSLGPWPKIGPESWLALPTPWLLAEAVVPYFNRLWWPRRFETVVLLATLPLAALALGELPWRRLAQVSGAALLLELWLVLDCWPITVDAPPHYDPQLYTGLDTADPASALLTLPLGAPVKDSRFALWMQVVHGHPISSGLGDHLPGHRPPAWLAWIEANPFTDALYDAAQGPLRARTVPAASLQDLQDAGLGWVVLDPQVLPAHGRAGWVRRYTTLVTAALGEPDLTRPGGGARWRITVPQDAVQLPGLGAPPELPPGT